MKSLFKLLSMFSWAALFIANVFFREMLWGSSMSYSQTKTPSAFIAFISAWCVIISIETINRLYLTLCFTAFVLSLFMESVLSTEDSHLGFNIALTLFPLILGIIINVKESYKRSD